MQGNVVIEARDLIDAFEEAYNDIPVWDDDDDWHRGIKEGIYLAMTIVNRIASFKEEYNT